MNLFWSNIFRKKAEEESLAYFLSTVPVFADLGGKDLAFLESLVHIRRYSPQEIVFEEGDTGSGMYVIRSGKVLIFTRSANNREKELALLGPGDFFGETTLAAPATRTASARTQESTELIGLFRADLLQTAQKHPTIANKILFGLTRTISERLQAINLESRRKKASLEKTPAADPSSDI